MEAQSVKCAVFVPKYRTFLQIKGVFVRQKMVYCILQEKTVRKEK